jgi:hypothetical protein
MPTIELDDAREDRSDELAADFLHHDPCRISHCRDERAANEPARRKLVLNPFPILTL